MNLTFKESTVINHMASFEKKYDEAGEPGFSDVMLQDIASALESDSRTAKGVVGSLIKKGLVYMQDVNGEYNIYYLTGKARQELGMQLVF